MSIIRNWNICSLLVFLDCLLHFQHRLFPFHSLTSLQFEIFSFIHFLIDFDWFPLASDRGCSLGVDFESFPQIHNSKYNIERDRNLESWERRRKGWRGCKGSSEVVSRVRIFELFVFIYVDVRMCSSHRACIGLTSIKILPLAKNLQ